MTFEHESGPRPPRLASWLAVLRVPAGVREFVLGDLAEEFEEIAASRRGVSAARRWYWRQALRGLAARHRPSGPLTETKERSMHLNLMQDIRFALRLLRRTPGFTITAIVTLALGIGASTAIFSVVDAVFLTPLPFPNGERLVIAEGGPTHADSYPISYPRFLEWRESGVFQETAAYFKFSATLTGEGDPEQLEGLRVSASLLSALSVRPIAGALFNQSDESRSVEPKVLVSERLWRGRFGGQPSIVGRRLILNGTTFTVVGVLPASFRIRPSSAPDDLVAPLRLNDQIAPASLNFMTAVGLLKPGQRLEQARDQLQTATRQRHPDVQPPPTVTVVGMRDIVAGNSAVILLSMLGAVGFLLLIGCANLANLLLARATGRRHEIAVRLAIGANRGRVAAQLLTESLVLALAGGAAGIGLAWLGVSMARQAPAVHAAGAYDVHVNLAALGFAVAVSMIAGVLFGAVPALDAGRQALRVNAGGQTRMSVGRPRLRSALVIVEVASALVLLVGAGLLTRSFANLLLADKGFDADRVLSFGLTTPQARYPTSAVQTRFFQTVLEGLGRLPGVTGVGFTSELPLAGSGTNGGVDIQGMTFRPGEKPMPEKRIASPGYFKAMGIPVMAGRVFTDRDTKTSPAVMVVSEGFAQRYFGSAAGAVGKRVAFNWDMDGLQEVIGVVKDVKHYDLGDRPLQMIYVSYLQRPIDYAGFVVKATGDPLALVADAQAVVRGVDKDCPLTQVDTMDGMIGRSVATRRFTLLLVAGFAILALVLASTGVYGVVSYVARQRMREFGIRVALGAGGGEIVRLVLRQGLIPAALGVLIGAGGALGLTRIIRSQLFGVEPSDPVTFAAVAACLVVVSTAACALPAWQATRVSPSSILRAE